MIVQWVRHSSCTQPTWVQSPASHTTLLGMAFPKKEMRAVMREIILGRPCGTIDVTLSPDSLPPVNQDADPPTSQSYQKAMARPWMARHMHHPGPCPLLGAQITRKEKVGERLTFGLGIAASPASSHTQDGIHLLFPQELAHLGCHLEQKGQKCR